MQYAHAAVVEPLHGAVGVVAAHHGAEADAPAVGREETGEEVTVRDGKRGAYGETERRERGDGGGRGLKERVGRKEQGESERMQERRCEVRRERFSHARRRWDGRSGKTT